MTPVTFRQIDRRLGLTVAMGYLVLALGGLIAWVGFLRLATFVDEFPSVKGIALIAVVLFVAPPVILVMLLYRQTEVRFTPDTIEVKTRGQAETKRIAIADVATADLNRSRMGALSLFDARDGLIHRFAPYNNPNSLEALTAALTRAGPFRSEPVAVKVFGTTATGRLLTRR